MRKLLRIGVIVLGAGASALAQRADDTGWVPVLQIRAVTAAPDGNVVNASGSWRLDDNGGPLAMTFSTGSTLCSVGTASGDASADGSRPTVWIATGDYAGVQAGRQQVRITTRFVRLAGRAAPPPTTQTLSLREGDEVTLDAISEAVDASCKVHTVAFEARLIMQPTDPALARAQYTADLWLVHDGPLSAQMREHLIVNVDGNAAVPFLFQQLSFTLPQVDPRQGNLAGVISLSGSLRARPRSDGLVDLDVDTNRMLYGLNTPGPALPSMVRKTLTLKPEETTAIDFPPPASGYASVTLGAGGGSGGVLAIAPGQGSAPPAAPAVEVKNDRLVVNTAQLFKGHKTQLLITLRKLR
jgi:hypothetical protein